MAAAKPPTIMAIPVCMASAPGCRTFDMALFSSLATPDPTHGLMYSHRLFCPTMHFSRASPSWVQMCAPHPARATARMTTRHIRDSGE